MIVISDGILDGTLWQQAKRKVLFVLKEPGADYGYKSLQELFHKGWNGQAKHSFLNLARWAYGIQSDDTERLSFPTFAEADNKAARNEAFFKSAIINLKKTPSINADRSCNEEKLRRYVIENTKTIRDQIKSIHPDVIVCCGGSTYELINEILFGGRGEIVILKAPHPSSRSWRNSNGDVRYTAKDKYDDVMNDYIRLSEWHAALAG